MKIRLLVCLASLALVAPAHAASSQWTKTPGGSVRLIVENPAASASQVRGAIQIDLDPGWKTYWREPGDAGVPPELDLSGSTNIKAHALSFPVPHRFEEGSTNWAGYKKPVFLPVTLTLAEPGKPVQIKGHAFLGICETICIPVTAQFEFSIDGTPSDPLSTTLVATAFEDLPAAASDRFGAMSASKEGDMLAVSVTLPADDPDIDIFVAGDGAVSLGMAKLKSREGQHATFSVPVISGKIKKPLVLAYTLVQGKAAVSGTIPVRE
ncbi:MAG: protein-disulfide reductase DsbD domain-containing protein [Phyllobacterium sp.]